MDEKICRLCLQIINDSNCQAIEESYIKPLKLNLEISKETVACIKCASWLQVFSTFAPDWVYKEEEALPSSDLQSYAKLKPEEIGATTSLDPLIKIEIKCSFCTEPHGREDLITLNESKENKFLVNVLKQYISKMDLKNIDEELLTCKPCLDALQGVLVFILKCFEVEEKISKYIELEGTDDKGQIELSEVQRFVFKPILNIDNELCGGNVLEYGCNQIQGECLMMAVPKIKYGKEISSTELIIKAEDVDIKSEQSDCNGFQEPFVGHKIPNDTLSKSVVTSEMRKRKRHLLTHKISSENKMPLEMKLFKCESCSFETKLKHSFTRHLLIHKSPLEVNIFKCDLCSYKTNRKRNLNRHSLTHKSPLEVKMFKCNLCAYEASCKSYLIRHLSIHNNPLKVKIFKCDFCPYKASFKNRLERHLLTHKSPLEVEMFKCESCSYETKYKSSLQSHLFTHKSPMEIRMYKCDSCSFAARRKSSLKTHLLFHKSPLEVTIFKCELCSYRTKYKSCLGQHFVTHKSLSEIKTFKCDLCTYETKRKQSLKNHLLTHKSPSEVKMFKCESCPFQTRHRSCIKKHLLTHRSPSEIKMFKCELCPHETKHVYCLKRHLLTHTSF